MKQEYCIGCKAYGHTVDKCDFPPLEGTVVTRMETEVLKLLIDLDTHTSTSTHAPTEEVSVTSDGGAAPVETVAAAAEGVDFPATGTHAASGNTLGTEGAAETTGDTGTTGTVDTDIGVNRS